MAAPSFPITITFFFVGLSESRSEFCNSTWILSILDYSLANYTLFVDSNVLTRTLFLETGMITAPLSLRSYYESMISACYYSINYCGEIRYRIEGKHRPDVTQFVFDLCLPNRGSDSSSSSPPLFSYEPRNDYVWQDPTNFGMFNG